MYTKSGLSYFIADSVPWLYIHPSDSRYLKKYQLHFSTPLTRRCRRILHCKNRLAIFPSPGGMSPNKLSLAGNKKSFLAKTSLVSDIPAGDGKIANLFYSVRTKARRIKLVLQRAHKTNYLLYTNILHIFSGNI